MSSLTMQCKSFFTYDSAVDYSCASALSKDSNLNAISCYPTSLSCAVESACASTKQDKTFTNSSCLSISPSSDGAISLPSSFVGSEGKYTSGVIASYNSDGCQGKLSSAGSYVLGVCIPSPFNDGNWGIVFNDFANNLWYDLYDDANCNTYTDSKLGMLLGKQGACTSKTYAAISNNQGFSTSFYYSDSCKTVGRIIQEASFGECKENTSCTLASPSSVSVKTVSCHSDPNKYDFFGTAQTTFGSKPYVIVELYGNKTCQSGAPTSKAAIILDQCYSSVGVSGSTIYTQAANASVVYTHYSKLGCTGDVSVRISLTATCDNYRKVSLFNSNVSIAVGGQFVASGPNKVSSESAVGTLGGLLVAAIFALLV
ncbi:UNVERIFIED_CONTAM: hypothetical protein HDU68_005882 [Siphonaria sp. JEL0065]|nr:hypothetical protein HDU68_005882 [Siphonaria sp. JEL0065]